MGFFTSPDTESFVRESRLCNKYNAKISQDVAFIPFETTIVECHRRVVTVVYFCRMQIEISRVFMSIDFDANSHVHVRQRGSKLIDHYRDNIRDSKNSFTYAEIEVSQAELSLPISCHKQT